MPRLTYDKVRTLVEENGCELLVTEEELTQENLNSKSFYKIRSQCGHENQIKFEMFKAMKCGILCKSCTRNNIIQQNKIHGKTTQIVEYNGFNIVRKWLESEFEVLKCVEGTLCDFMVRPINIKSDAWLPIQLKVTSRPRESNSNNCYFPISRKYNTCVVLCLCLQDERAWIIPGADITQKRKIGIGCKKSKYDQYKVTQNTICTQAKVIFDSGAYNEKKAILNSPISIAMQQEQRYRTAREQAFPRLLFVYPECEGLPYDFTVDGVKVQEKVATPIKRKIRGYVLQCCRSSKRQYDKGDADYYWFNIPDTTYFYLVPEDKLIEHEHVGTIGGRLHIHLYPYNDADTLLANGCKTVWMNDYLFDYSKLTHVTSIAEIMASKTKH